MSYAVLVEGEERRPGSVSFLIHAGRPFTAPRGSIWRVEIGGRREEEQEVVAGSLLPAALALEPTTLLTT